MPKRAAMPGRCQTGSMAILLTLTSAPGSVMLEPVVGAWLRITILPSIGIRPARTASSISLILRWARVIEAELRTSMPGCDFANRYGAMWPSGSNETILPSSHEGCCGEWIGGSVLARSGVKLGLM